jgi:glycosyltransferase involved in cell wall biosynthesis/cellulose synthase/poly-beta-1,6-N-acetylglucosamine synthase-like glycosyltransferase
LEVVLVNDGGCDLDVESIAAVLGDVSLTYERLERNRGRACAANTGIRAARGDYVGFLDDDDEFYPEHVETLVTFLNQSDYRVAYTDTEMVFTDFSADQGRFVDTDRVVFSRDFFYQDLLISNNIPFNSILFPREVLVEIGDLDESFEMYEDWDFLIRAAGRYPFYHIKKTTARYNQWSRSLQINRSDTDLMQSMNLRILDKHHEKIAPAMLQLKVHNEDLRRAVQDATTRADHFELISGERDRHIKKLEMAINETRAHYQGIVKDNEARIAQLESAAGEKDARIAHVQSVLAAIQATLGWKLLERMRRVREKALPVDTRRRLFYDLAVKSVKVVRNEGVRGFLAKASRRVKGLPERVAILARKGYSVYRSYGAKTFLKYTYKYVRYGGGYFGASGTARIAEGDRYAFWISQHETVDDAAARRDMESFTYRPTISIITPVYNVDPRWLSRCIESVRSQRYADWQLCIYDDASTNDETVRALKGWQGEDQRIAVSFGAVNQGISAASNHALKMATGEFVALLDNDDELSPEALYEVVRLLNAHPDADLIYSDEDRITENGDGSVRRHEPFFKPDWSPQLLFACMYTGHLSVYRKSLVDSLGGFRSEFDFSQDYDLALRVTEKTTRIRHLPKVLYHWRAIPQSAAGGGKDFARSSNIAALKAACERRGYDAEVLALPCANRVKFRIGDPPLISIVIPTDSRKNIFNCIDLLLRNTSYPRYEIVVVTHAALGNEILTYFPGKDRIRVSLFEKPFNFSLKCNEGASAARGDYLLFLNDDVEALDQSWLDDMLRVLGRGNIGGVSPKLFYENDLIQYAGMVTGVRGLVGTAFHCEPKDSCAYFNFIQSERNVSLLTGACLLMPKKVFDEVGGYDALNTPVMHSDVDLCCRIRQKGYNLVYTPFAALRHIGHLSLRTTDHHPASRKDKADVYLLKKWGDFLSRDPYYPENMRTYLYREGFVPYRMCADRQDARFDGARDILFVSHDLSLSGAPILMYHLACHFRAKGYFVAVMSPHDGELAEQYRAEGIPLIVDATLASEPHPETKKFMAAFDLIVANTIFMWPSVFAAKEEAVPVMWLLHESRAGQKAAFENPRVAEALGRADEVIFACKATAGLFDKFNVSGNFRVIHYGTRSLSANSREARRNEKFTIVHIGSIEPRKGQDILVEGIRKLPPAYADAVKVFLIGRSLENEESREHRRALMKTVSSLPHVHLTGQIPHERIADYLAGADVFVSSSRDDVFPLTVLEAMSVGKAIIATDVGGVSEMIRDGEDGIVIPAGNTDLLARNIMHLMDDPEARKRMGDSARNRFIEHFTVERLGDDLIKVIEERVGRPR